MRVIIEVSLTVLFIASMGYGWEGRLMAWLIASVAMFIVSFIYFKKRGLLTLRLRRSFMKISILFGLPLILHVVGKFVINQSDRIFITKMVSLEEAGIYNIGYQVGTIMLIIVSATGNFMQPFLYERLSNLTRQAKTQIVKLSYSVIAAFCIILILITLATPTFFATLIDKTYARGTVYVFWVGLSYFFWGVYLVFASYIFYSGKTKILGWLALVNVVFNLVLNYFLIQLYGPLGAAYATCWSYFIVCVVIVYMANKLYPLPWLGTKLLTKDR
jgi:O-antigen/teichoic acid export membrane protein